MAGKRRRRKRKKKRPGDPGSAQDPEQTRDLESADESTDPDSAEPRPDLESTLTEASEALRPLPEGPEIEAPEPTQPDKPLEIGPTDEVDASDETHTDVLRVGESVAEAEEPVSHPHRDYPDPAPGTQPSLSDPTTETDVDRIAADETRSEIYDADQHGETRTDVGSPGPSTPRAPARGEPTETDVFRPEEPEPGDGPTRTDVERPEDPPARRRGDPTQTDIFRPEEPDKREEPTRTDVERPEDRPAKRKGDPTKTDVFRPGEPIEDIHDLATRSDQAFGDRETDTRQNGEEDETRTFAGDDDETRSEFADLTSTDTPCVHDDSTADIEEAEEPDRTRSDLALHERSTTDAPEPEPVPAAVMTGLERAPIETGPEPAPADEEPEPEPVPIRRKRRAGPPLRQRLKEFLSPKKFFRGVREDFKAMVDAWKRTGRQSSAILRLEKNAEWWRRTVIELAALFAIVVPIEMVVTGGRLGSFGVHPHPYWLIVLPMAGARGVVAGLLAAAMASLFYTIGAWQSLHTFDLFQFKIMTEPILFFGVGFFAGELHDELALRYRKIQRRLEEVNERNQSLREERDVLSDANKLLERRIVDASVQFGNLVVAARRIEKAERREAFEIALEMVEEHCGAASSVLLIVGEGGLDYLCHNGWPEDEESDRLAIAREAEFVRRAIETGRAVNGFSAEEEPPEKGPLAVAPLAGEDGHVRALLCLDDIPASRLNESTITIFFNIAEWLNAALSRLERDARRVAAPSAGLSGPMGEVWLGGPDDLGKRLRVELERCARYGVPTSFLAIQAPEWRDTSRDGIDAIDRYMALHFTGGLRPSDTIYRFGYPGCYLLVLAGTTVEGAEVVRTRLMRRVDYAPAAQIGPIEIFATGPDADAPDLLSLVERVARRFRQSSPLPLAGKCPVEVPSEMVESDLGEFVRRLRIEISLATRNSFALNVIGIAAEIPQEGHEDLLARHVRDAGEQSLRPTDGVYAIGPSRCAVILPCTGGDDAAKVAHRLVQAIRARDPDAPYGAVETQVLALGSPHLDVTSFLQALSRGGERHA